MHKAKETNVSRFDQIRYIQAMLAEMRNLAERERCDMLTYMIDMAYIEATDIIEGERPASWLPDDKRNAVA